MPIYEFVCADCKKSFEKLCSLKDDLSKITCEYCKSGNVKKQISTCGPSGCCCGSGHSCASCGSHSCSSCSH